MERCRILTSQWPLKTLILSIVKSLVFFYLVLYSWVSTSATSQVDRDHSKPAFLSLLLRERVNGTIWECEGASGLRQSIIIHARWGQTRPWALACSRLTLWTAPSSAECSSGGRHHPSPSSSACTLAGGDSTSRVSHSSSFNIMQIKWNWVQLKYLRYCRDSKENPIIRQFEIFSSKRILTF